ncbi:cell wall anchor protein [Chryseobacterium sp. 2TAF14]|uniref:cell wall anchor protein n=1 Tax=Chryseobacterium sp. 2TAF14 TaxID=3233007 RepID=UPI003F93DD71
MKKKLLFIGLVTTSLFYSQTSNTQTRDDAGAPTVTSGFYQTSNPINYPSGASNWWHLLDVRHSNSANNYGMQFAGSFFDQDLYFRKTNNSSSQSWMRAVLETPSGNVKIGKNDPSNSEASLRVFKADGTYVEIANSLGNFQIARSVCNDCWAVGARTGDTVFRTLSSVAGASQNLLFSIPNNGNDGGSYVGFEDNYNGVWAKFFNNATARFNGKIFAKEVEVKANVWADYVFAKDYNLKTLDEVEKHIAEKGHLPNIPSAAEVMEKGINVAEMDAKLLEKIEELTLYSIEQNKQIKKLQEENKQLQKQSEKISVLEKQLQELLSSKK